MNDQIFDLKSLNELPPTIGNPPPQKRSVWQFVKDNKIAFSAGFAVILLGLMFWFFLSGSSTAPAVTSDKVVLLIKGPEKLTSGNEAEYKIIYRNGENADLVGISLEVIYPSNFKYTSASQNPTSNTGQRFNLPILREGQDGEVVIRGKLSGSVGESKEVKAKLSYKLSNFNSEFSVQQSFRTELLPPNFSLEFSGPIEVITGQDTTFSVNYANVSGNEYDNVAVKLTYPEGFKLVSSSPPAGNQGYWNLGKLALNAAGKIDITGSFVGDTGSDKLVVAEIGQLSGASFAPLLTTTGTFKLAKSALSLQQSVQQGKTAKLGETLQFKLNYANEGAIGMSNVNIVVNLEGVTIDSSRITSNDGVITGNTLTWKAATLPGLSVLSPSERGEINFSVPVRTQVPGGVKNQSIRSTATIQSVEMPKPIRAADLEIKVVSQTTVAISGDYIGGAMPMKVGSPTLFAITVLVTNMSNDLTNTELDASIPLPSSAWKNIIIPESEKSRLTYDPNSGKMKWKIGNLPAFVGRYSPALKVTFQLEVTPTDADQGQVMTLLQNITMTGHDSFVDQKVDAQPIHQVTVGDLGDDVIDSRGSTVQ